jgi:phosphoglycerol transferase
MRDKHLSKLISNGGVTKRHITVATLVAFLSQGVFAFLFSTKWGSVVLGDELIFAIQIAKVDPANATYSNQFYNWLYSLWDWPFDDVVLSATLLNGLFAAGSNVALFAIALRFLRPWASVGVSIGTSISTVWINAAYVMPEVPYYFFSIAAILAFLLAHEKRFCGHGNVIAFAVLFSLATLTKPHAWALLLAVGVAFLFTKSNEKKPWQAFSVFVVLAVFARVVIGLVVGGFGTLNLLGGYATGLALFPDQIFSPASPELILIPDSRDYPSALNVLLSSSAPYIAAFVVLFGFLWWSSPTKTLSGKIFFSLARSYSVILTIGALLFSILVSTGGDDHTDRILVRYFEFLFALSIVSIGFFLSRAAEINFKRALFIAGLQLLALAYLSLFSNITLIASDSVVLAFFVGFPYPYVAMILLLVALASRGRQIKTLVERGLTIGTLGVWLIYQSFSWGNFDQGMTLSGARLAEVSETVKACRQSDEDRILFVSNERYLAAKARLDEGQLNDIYGYLPANAGLSEAFPLPAGYECGIFIGDFAFDQELNPFILKPGIAAIRPGEAFKEPHPRFAESYTANPSGLITAWGFWSEGDSITLSFSKPLKEGDLVKIELALGEGSGGSEIFLEMLGVEYQIDLGEVGVMKTVDLDIPQGPVAEIKISLVESGITSSDTVPPWLDISQTLGLSEVIVVRVP